MIRLKEWRQKRGLSLRTLADISGVHYISLVRIEGGVLDPRLSTLLKLSAALQIEISDLIETKQNQTSERRRTMVKRHGKCPQEGCSGVMLNRTNTAPFQMLGHENIRGVRKLRLRCSVCGHRAVED
jgi:transcriptional regulator with XRE-family HTH domain